MTTVMKTADSMRFHIVSNKKQIYVAMFVHPEQQPNVVCLLESQAERAELQNCHVVVARSLRSILDDALEHLSCSWDAVKSEDVLLPRSAWSLPEGWSVKVCNTFFDFYTVQAEWKVDPDRLTWSTGIGKKFNPRVARQGQHAYPPSL